jgi:2-amino-4-hydroxy-6-hydroxymethyldihydropteridine diphosphokinase
MLVYLALGSNLGNRVLNLSEAIVQIAEKTGKISAVSSVYETQSWGFESENLFLNQVISVDTGLSPLEILAETLKIERNIGRTEKTNQVYQDRIIDIDLILCDNLVFKSEILTLPHPLFHQRRFVLEPLSEIAPDLIHPILKKTINRLFEDLQAVNQTV